MRQDHEASSSERVPDFLGLAGSVVVPVERRGVEWSVVVSAVRSSRAHLDDEVAHVGWHRGSATGSRRADGGR